MTLHHRCIHSVLRRIAATAAVAVTLALAVASPAQASPGDLTLSIETEALRPSSATAGLVTDIDTILSPGVIVGYGLGTPLELDLVIGYRHLGVQRPATVRTLDLEAQSHLIVAGLRGRFPIVGRWLYVVGHAELEAQAAELKARFGGRSGSDTTWTAGATLRGGLELLWTISADLAFRWRAVVGYSGRLDADFDDVQLTSQVPNTAPLNLGGLNLSGVVAGMHAELRF